MYIHAREETVTWRRPSKKKMGADARVPFTFTNTELDSPPFKKITDGKQIVKTAAKCNPGEHSCYLHSYPYFLVHVSKLAGVSIFCMLSRQQYLLIQ
jgi:hypothetical protein